MIKKSLIIIILIIVIVMLLAITANFLYNGSNEIIYHNTSYYPMGSITLRIYDNGKVEEDREIEEPNHTPNFKIIKELTKAEISQLKSKLDEETDKTKIQEYINELVYGSKNINLTPNYNF